MGGVVVPDPVEAAYVDDEHYFGLQRAGVDHQAEHEDRAEEAGGDEEEDGAEVELGAEEGNRDEGGGDEGEEEVEALVDEVYEGLAHMLEEVEICREEGGGRAR